MNDLDTALEQAAAPREQVNVKDKLEMMRPELARSLRREDAADALARSIYTAYRYSPLLRQCSPDSIIGAALLSAQVGLEPGPLGHVYLLPFYNSKLRSHEVVWMLGYTGIIALGRRGGATGLTATVVWDADAFTEPWQNEKGWHWSYRPAPDPAARTERVGVLVTWKESERVGLFMPPSRVETALNASPMGAKGHDRRELDWYWRKTAVRFARPWLPLTVELAQAAAADDAIVHGVEPVDGEAMPVLEAANGGE